MTNAIFYGLVYNKICMNRWIIKNGFKYDYSILLICTRTD